MLNMRIILLQVSLADAQVHEFPHHLRDHLVMEAISIARFSNFYLHLEGHFYLHLEVTY